MSRAEWDQPVERVYYPGEDRPRTFAESKPIVVARHWAVYQNPSDFPGQHVLRVWMCLYGGKLMAETEPRAVGTLDEVRAALPSGLVRVGRMPKDDPAILEVWL